MLRKATADVVVVGAGVAGCSAFYHLAKLNRLNRAFKPILVDALPPLSLTRCVRRSHTQSAHADDNNNSSGSSH